MAYAIDSSTGQAISQALYTLHNADINQEGHSELTSLETSVDMDTSNAASPALLNGEGIVNQALTQHNAFYGTPPPAPAPHQQNKRSVSVSDSESETENKKINRSSERAGENSKSSTDYEYNVPTRNMFGELGEVGEGPESNRFPYLKETCNDQIIPANRIPPIYVANIPNVSNFINELKTKVTKNFVTDVKNNKIKINSSSATDYRNIVKYLIHSQRSFHTYKDPANNKYSVVFKNLHTSISEDDIKEDLKSQHPSIIKITRLNKDNKPIPVVAAEFSGAEPIESILTINSICNHRVTTEKEENPKVQYSVKGA